MWEELKLRNHCFCKQLSANGRVLGRIVRKSPQAPFKVQVYHNSTWVTTKMEKTLQNAEHQLLMATTTMRLSSNWTNPRV